jgi:integrase
MPDASFHDLRRANATALIAENVDVKTAQSRLGHADPWMTLAVYARATSAADRRAAERLWSRFVVPHGQLSVNGRLQGGRRTEVVR